jgi:TRAP-type transport system small permease protein
MHALARLSAWATNACASVAAFTLLGLAVAGTLDVLGTWLLGVPLPATRELSSEFLAILIFFSFGYAQLRNEHVAVDLFYARFPPRAQHAVQIVALLIGLGLFAALAWRFTGAAWASWEMRETAAALVAYPIFPFKFAVAFAAWITALEYLHQLVARISGAGSANDKRGDAAERSV